MQGDLPLAMIDTYWHTAALPLWEGVAMDAVTVGQQGVTWGFGIAKTATQMGVSVEDSESQDVKLRFFRFIPSKKTHPTL